MIPIRINRLGGLGNRTFQYLFSKSLEQMVPGSKVVNVSLPEFGIEVPNEALPKNSLTLAYTHHVDMLDIAWSLRSGTYGGLGMKAYVQRLQYYPIREEVSGFLPAPKRDASREVGADELVINVRGNEVLGDVHEDYGPVPVDFFSQIADQTGLTPVIVGQLGDDSYSDEIRRRFAGCDIRESVSPISDFDLIRTAKNVVFGVSTFSWLATWLSESVEQIFMPVSGIFNPRQRPDIDLLPLNDSRYHFFRFPERAWKATPHQLSELITTGKQYPEFTRSEIGFARHEGNSLLYRTEQGVDIAELNILRRDRDRLQRELARVAHEASTSDGQTR